MSFSEMIRLLKEFKEEFGNAKRDFQELKKVLEELLREIRRLNENLEKGCRP